MPTLPDWVPPLFAFWKISAAFDFGRYLIAAPAMALILVLFWRAGLAGRKIQRRSATAADVRREILTSLRTAFLFSLIGVVIFVGTRHGLFTLYPTIEPAGVPYLVLSTVAVVLAHDTYFYWTHRAMHHPRLFRFFHYTHHKSVTPTPFAAYAFAVPEALVQGAFSPLWLLFVPMHELGMLAFLTFMIVRNVMGHAGVELMPRGLADSRWFGWINATTHHDLHHATFHHNYGLYFTWWDRLMGTEHPRYRELLRDGRQPGTAAAPLPLLSRADA